MKYKIYIVVLFSFIISCKEPTPRRPKQHSTTNFYKELMDKNRQLNAMENKNIEYWITRDTTHVYEVSPNGFWYTYVKKDSVNSITPKTGDVVTVDYNITDIVGNVIYNTQQKEHKVDKQDFIPALQDGIKLMKKGETITFVIPSYKAFGMTGDENKIGINQTIKSTVTLIDIKPNNNNENN